MTRRRLAARRLVACLWMPAVLLAGAALVGCGGGGGEAPSATAAADSAAVADSAAAALAARTRRFLCADSTRIQIVRTRDAVGDATLGTLQDLAEITFSDGREPLALYGNPMTGYVEEPYRMRVLGRTAFFQTGITYPYRDCREDDGTTQRLVGRRGFEFAPASLDPVQAWTPLQSGERRIWIGDAALVADSVVSVEARPAEAGGHEVVVILAESDAEAFAVLTESRVGEILALLFEGRLLAAPTVGTRVDGGRVTIAMATPAEAESLAEALRTAGVAGPPAPDSTAASSPDSTAAAPASAPAAPVPDAPAPTASTPDAPAE